MVKRRNLLLGAGATGLSVAGGSVGYMVAQTHDTASYEEAATKLRSPLGSTADFVELVRYATLAANSHNTQPWRFKIEADAISILPDLTRQTPAVDPDDHHLFASLGCAAENLILAAQARGLLGVADFSASSGDSIRVALEPSRAEETSAFSAITSRQVTRADYDGKAIPSQDLAQIIASARRDEVDVMIVTERSAMERILDLVVSGSNAQYGDRAYVSELKQWIRFNDSEALASSDGLFTRTTGNPTLPSWIGRAIFDWIVTAKGESETVVRQMKSSVALAIFVGKTPDRAHWVEVGRSYQRFALEATALGIKHAFINQAVEVASTRAQLATELGIPGRRPDLIVRLGYGHAMPWSLRRPVASVVV